MSEEDMKKHLSNMRKMIRQDIERKEIGVRRHTEVMQHTEEVKQWFNDIATLIEKEGEYTEKYGYTAQLPTQDFNTFFTEYGIITDNELLIPQNPESEKEIANASNIINSISNAINEILDGNVVLGARKKGKSAKLYLNKPPVVKE